MERNDENFGGHRPPLQKKPGLRADFGRRPERRFLFPTIDISRATKVRGQIIDQSGPFLLSGNWWDEKAWARAEWDMQLENGDARVAHMKATVLGDRRDLRLR